MIRLALKILISIILFANPVFAVNTDTTETGAYPGVTYYVTVAGAGDNSGGSWATAMSWAGGGGTANFQDILQEDSGTSELAKGTDGTAATTGGTIFYVYNDGTNVYTLAGAVDCGADGRGVSPYIIRGVDAQSSPPTPAEWHKTTAGGGPLFVAAANSFSLDDYWATYNIRWTTTHAAGFKIDTSGIVSGCSGTNSGAGGGLEALTLSIGLHRVLHCDLQSTNGTCIITDAGDIVRFNYLHDSDRGIHVNDAYNDISFNIIERIVDEGLYNQNKPNLLVSNDTFYKCGGEAIHLITGGAGYGNTIINNIFDGDGSGTGLKLDRACGDAYIDYNNYWDLATDFDGLGVSCKGPNANSADPQFVDPDNADSDLRDFSLASGAASVDAGMSIGLGVQ